ncbi:MAG: DUF4430 domain-containing protein [Candidatus Woesebacteria bacterium]|nr:DUF4430 domain-containing protein [Candidatus Woesebacteria bacterium]
MKKYTKLLKALLILLLIVVLGYFIFTKVDNRKTKDDTVQVQTNEISIDASKFIGKTALEATKAGVKEIKLEGSGINAYITSLNGRTADTTKNEFWEFDINGKASEVGAGSYIIKAEDKIIWKITNF